MADRSHVDVTECCGNGCTNCVLYAPKKKMHVHSKENKENLLEIYRKFRLIEYVALESQILRLKFVYDANLEVMKHYTIIIPLGHHVMMRAPLIDSADINETTQYILRPYSPFWIDADQFQFMILINLKANGAMSSYIEKLQLNNFVEFKIFNTPLQYNPKRYEHLVMFSHGVAIAPIMRIINEILGNEDDDTIIYNFSCFKDLKSIIFREQLHGYKNYWNFNNQIYLAKEHCNECDKDITESCICDHFMKKLKYKEKIKPSRLETHDVVEVFNNIKTNSIGIIVCGYKTFIDFITESLSNISIENELFIL